jgi:hypothetical protein
MKAKFKLDDVRELNATMEITMPIRTWIELRDQLNQAYPSWKFRAVVDELITKAEREFFEESKSKTL